MSEWTYYESRSYGDRLTPMVRKLLYINLGVFVAQMLFGRLVAPDVFGLSLNGIRHGFVWQFGTYMFLHAGVMHILLNMLMLYFMGPETERSMGSRHFLAMYLLSGVLGGLGWLLITPSTFAPCIGASGAVFGVLAAYAALHPHRPITLLLFFVLPVTLKAWTMALAMGVIELLYLINSPDGGIAYAAHIAGGITGFIYARTVFRGARLNDWLDRLRSLWPARPGSAPFPHTTGDHAPAQEEVDRLLDKISAKGIQSLSKSERDLLYRASRRKY